jgi:putative acetyltransferase
MLANSPQDSVHFARPFRPCRARRDLLDGVGRRDAARLRCAQAARFGAHGEIKSMRTAAEHLRRGTGAKLVGHMLSVARARGYKRVSLETGSGETFEAAHALYRQFGFTETGPFGEYREDPFSRFLSRVV